MSKKCSNSVNPATKWKLDMGGRRDQLSRIQLDPPGYTTTGVIAHVSESASSERAEQAHLLTKRSWEIALAPLKGIPMNMFVMYMAGSSISIFPIMMIGMMGMRPLKALFSLSSTFRPLSSNMSSLLLQKIVFVLGNICAVGLALYKCHSMGLLPTHASDWLHFVAPPNNYQQSGGGIAFG